MLTPKNTAISGSICTSGTLLPSSHLLTVCAVTFSGHILCCDRFVRLGRPLEIDEDLFFEQLKELKDSSEIEDQDIRPLVKKIVPTYTYKQ